MHSPLGCPASTRCVSSLVSSIKFCSHVVSLVRLLGVVANMYCFSKDLVSVTLTPKIIASMAQISTWAQIFTHSLIHSSAAYWPPELGEDRAHRELKEEDTRQREQDARVLGGVQDWCGCWGASDGLEMSFERCWETRAWRALKAIVNSKPFTLVFLGSLWRVWAEQWLDWFIFSEDHLVAMSRTDCRLQGCKYRDQPGGYCTDLGRRYGSLDQGRSRGRSESGYFEERAYRDCWLFRCRVWEKEMSQGWLLEF